MRGWIGGIKVNHRGARGIFPSNGFCIAIIIIIVIVTLPAVIDAVGDAVRDMVNKV